MTGTTFSRFTPVNMWPDPAGNTNLVLMSTGGGVTWSVVPISGGGTGQTTAQAAIDALTGGNLNLSGNAARITGNFNDSTIANRTMFVSRTPGLTAIDVAPNGPISDGTIATALVLEDQNSTTGAGSIARLDNVQNTEMRLVSTSRNGGAVLPLSFYVGQKHTTLSLSSGFASHTTHGDGGAELAVDGLGAHARFGLIRDGYGNPIVDFSSPVSGVSAQYLFDQHTFRRPSGQALFVVGNAGQVGVGFGSIDYGNPGTVLQSGGAGAPASWTSSLANGITAVTQPPGTSNTTLATTEFAYTNFVKKSELKGIPNDLMVTALGSLDIQFTVGNSFSTWVDQAGTPSYITNLNTPGDTSNKASILGNASGAGTNYTVINTAYAGIAVGDTTSHYNVSGTISMVLDVAQAMGLSNDQYLSGTTTINPAWKGNYNFSAFSALFKLSETNFWDYPATGATTGSPGYNAKFQYAVDMLPVTNDYTSSDYGKYNVSSTVYAAASYHSANLGARWLGIATKIRNV